MDNAFYLSALIGYLILIFVAGLAMAFLTLKLFGKIFLNAGSGQFLRNRNVSAAIFFATVLVSEAIFSGHTIQTIQQNLHASALIPSAERLNYLLMTAGLGFLQVVVTFLIVLLIAWTSTKLFDLLTKGISELQEMGENNIAVGLLLSGLILSLTLLLQQPFGSLVANLVPLPAYQIPQ